VRAFLIFTLWLLALGTNAATRTAAKTATPIEHLIIVIGENISFDTLFGTYRPQSGAKVHNLLSQGIVNRDGSPGPEFTKATQRRAEVHDNYQVTPRVVDFLWRAAAAGDDLRGGAAEFSAGSALPRAVA
jgi:phospholipase C